jgi:1-acyl-sn-glycerol-3-phosphate acyltransferase
MFYSLMRFIFSLIFGLLFRWRIIGQENIPRTGGVIIAPNHISNVDPPLVGTAMHRHATFMAKEELFSPRWFGIILKNLGAFPIKRGAGDRAAIRTALDILADGQALILFPEGTRSKTGTLGKAQPGVAMIALKSQVPVVPVAITGTNQVFCNGHWLPRFTVRFGKPIYPPEGERANKETMEAFSAKVMEEIARSLEKEV